MNKLAKSEDPLQKREEFGISLRKEKKRQILGEKRRRAMERIKNITSGTDSYFGYEPWIKNKELLSTILPKLLD